MCVRYPSAERGSCVLARRKSELAGIASHTHTHTRVFFTFPHVLRVLVGVFVYASLQRCFFHRCPTHTAYESVSQLSLHVANPQARQRLLSSSLKVVSLHAT